MLDCLTSGLGHPLIHLGYAFELDSQQLAAEALGLLATCYDASLATLLAKTTPKSQDPTSDLFELFSRVHDDAMLPTFKHPGDQNSSIHSRQLRPHGQQSSPTSTRGVSPTSQPAFHQLHRLAALLLISTSPQLNSHGYDFFIVHLLTTSYALRAVLPSLPAQHHATVLRQWLLMALLVYTAQNRPRPDPSYITSVDLQTRISDWELRSTASARWPTCDRRALCEGVSGVDEWRGDLGQTMMGGG